jgi:uncharacterized membrane protein YphA (DoxX/SURF4 family)
MINCSISQSIQLVFRPFSLGSRVSLSLDIFASFFVPALLCLGLFTRLACIPLIVAMSVALFNAHQGDAFGNGEERQHCTQRLRLHCCLWDPEK